MHLFHSRTLAKLEAQVTNNSNSPELFPESSSRECTAPFRFRSELARESVGGIACEQAAAKNEQMLWTIDIKGSCQ
jgi:hypothetical protein